MTSDTTPNTMMRPDPSTPDRPSEPAGLILARADHVIVEKQNLNWLSRRFAFQHHLLEFHAARGGEALGLELSPLSRLPKWQRWPIMFRRALLEADPEARKRIKASLGFRLFRRPPIEVVLQPIQALDSNEIDEQAYQAWIAHYDELGPADRLLLSHAAAALPEILVIIRFDAASLPCLGPAVEQLAAQIHPAWRARLLLAPDTDNGDIDPATIETVRHAVAAERRVEIATTELAPDDLQPGTWLVLADPSVVLRPETLATFADLAARDPALRLIYADEDRIDPDGTRREPSFKPRFSPEFNRRLDYLGPCIALHADLLRDNPPGATPIAAWAAATAARLAPAQVARVARVLFHVAPVAPFAHGAPATPHRAPNPQATPSVAIIIPTRNLAAFLRACIDSIRTKSRYPADQIHIIVVDNGSDDADTLAYLDRLRAEPWASVIPDPRPFNYAALNNVAADAATADILVFLNNDTEVDDPDWLAQMAGWAAQPGIGVVGPKLLYPDRSIQHGGVVLGIGGVAGHSFIGLGADTPGYMGLADITREASALTGACIAVRRSVFEEIGGFDERLDVAFNDTALCCEAVRLGYRNLYLGETSVIHHESKSRGFDDTPEKLARFRAECLMVRARYRDLFDEDPYYSPNLGLERQYQPAVPRLARTWRRHRRAFDPNPRILILSDVHAVGHGVPVVIKQHAEYLAALGWAIFVGGPMQRNEIAYVGCHRVYLEGKLEAQSFAYEADVDAIIAHTIPYFSMYRTMGGFPRRVIFDHGEPPPAWFPDDRLDRENIDAEKQFAYRLADLVLTNTTTVKEEIGYGEAEVAGLGNSHLALWNPALALRRDQIRAELGLADHFVVLNVCRFHKAERHYKGIADYVALKARLAATDPARAARIAIVLCGKGKDEDIAEMTAQGLTVMANVTDQALIDLYAAADLYVNFSKWEGFNLGIAQALAMGLPVVASDIHAHRQFPIQTTDDEANRARLVLEAASMQPGERRAVVMDWQPLLDWLRRRLITLCERADEPLSHRERGVGAYLKLPPT